jgi:hypothetical protein
MLGRVNSRYSIRRCKEVFPGSALLFQYLLPRGSKLVKAPTPLP